MVEMNVYEGQRISTEETLFIIFGWHSLLPYVGSGGPFQFPYTVYFSVVLYHIISSSHTLKFSFLSGQ